MEDLSSLHSLAKGYITIRQPRMQKILKIQAAIGAATREYLDTRGFIELLPPIIGPVTDPGIRGAQQVSVDYYGQEFRIMSSAILYKQMAMASLERIYFFSPNIRLEPLETVKTRRHLCEFVQVDIEEANASYDDAMGTAEGLLHYVCKRVKEHHEKELQDLGRTLRIPKRPFKRITHREAVDLLRSNGHEIDYKCEIPWAQEEVISAMFDEPFFIYDYPRGARGFYDREDPKRPGTLRDFDLIYPEGYGEAISGAEREYRYEQVIQRIKEGNESPEDYGWYLDMLQYGIPPSAGFGIGIERLTRFVCGLTSIWEARPYPKVSGIISP
ncbi:MAG: asparagine synthetase A [Candidatus Heimdallarchaeota archaeon]